MAMLTTPATRRPSPLRLVVSFCSRLLTSWPLRHWKIIVPGLAVLAALVLPANLLATQRFHYDEALYATWALQITSGADPWLTHTPIDKPPLFLYVVAGALELLGVTETAARVPSLLATALTVFLTFSLGRKLYGVRVGIVAAWLVVLSPFTLLFAPTAFTDPLLVTLVLAACLAAAHGRAGWAGVSTGLAIATKQQGVFFVPLVMALLVIYDLRFTIYDLRFTTIAPGAKRRGIYNLRTTPHASRLTPHASSFLLAALLTLLPVFIWDLNRSQVPDFLAQSLANYGGLITDTASVGERWWGFVGLLRYAIASPALNLIFVAGLPALLIYGLTAARQPIRHFFQSQRKPETGHNPAPPRPHSSTDFLFTLFTILFLLGHALFSFQAWDRYLLGLIPFLALLLARILLLPWSVLKTTWLDARPDRSPLAGMIYSLVLAGLLALTLARPVQDAVNGRYPLGSHSQALSGIEQIVAYLQGHAGANHTLYHRWLGTHWRFYLWDYPYDLQYWASPQELALKAKPGHLIAFPSWQSDTEARLALAGAGLTLRELTRAFNPAGYPSIVLYQIVPGRP